MFICPKFKNLSEYNIICGKCPYQKGLFNWAFTTGFPMGVVLLLACVWIVAACLMFSS